MSSPNDEGGWQGPPHQGYGQPGYGQAPQSFGQAPQGYGQAPQSFGQAPEGSGPPPGYGPPPTGYGPPAGYGQQPPKRKRGLIILAIAVGIVLVVANVIGFFARDFFRHDDDAGTPVAGQGPATGIDPSAGPTDSSGPDADAPRLANAVVMTTKFLGYLNTNNQQAASAMGCEGSKQLLPTAISLIVDESTNLKAGTATVEEPGTSAYPMRMDLVTISGTVKYRPTNGWVRIQDVPGEPLCVRMFQTS